MQRRTVSSSTPFFDSSASSDRGATLEDGRKPITVSEGSNVVVTILLIVLVGLGAAILGVGIATLVSSRDLLDDCNDYQELKDALTFEPCEPEPECVSYDINKPPPGWPEFAVPWASRQGQANPCSLTPPLVNINATTAMQGYEKQDLGSGSKVIIIDVRDPNEYYWVGAATQVNRIVMKNNQTYIPKYFLATLEPTCDDSDNRVHFIDSSDDSDVSVSVADIARTEVTGVSYNVPVEYVDGQTGVKTLNPLFGKQLDAIVRENGADRIIFYCRSGQRSSIGCYYKFCPFEQLFPGILGMQMIAYEVESAITNGRGGFQGTDYSNAFLGYRGFPGRNTDNLDVSPSAAFMDAGLPMDTGMLPKTVRVQPLTGETLHIDTLDAAPWAESP